MVLSTQVPARNRQTASLYPYPLTPLLGALNLASACITAGILGDFVAELLAEEMSVPTELIVVFAVAVITAIEQTVSFIRQKFSVYPAKLNLAIHLALSVFWIIAFSLLTSKVQRMVLTSSCNLSMWKTEMGLMVCRMYKAMYAFSAVCVATSVGGATLDWTVMREGSAGVYRPLEDQTPDMRKTMSVNMTPLMRGEKEVVEE